MLWLYQRVMLGKVNRDENRSLEDMRVFGWGRGAREFWYLVPLVLLTLWIGLYPKPFFDITAASTGKVVEAVQIAAARMESPKVAAAKGAAPSLPAAAVAAAPATPAAGPPAAER